LQLNVSKLLVVKIQIKKIPQVNKYKNRQLKALSIDHFVATTTQYAHEKFASAVN
jgi:hypothetical protein